VAKTSLLLNLVLLGVLAYQAYRPISPPGSFPLPTAESPRVESAPATHSKPEAEFPNGIRPAPPGSPIDWHHLESTDYRVYIANLRAIGCPEQTIRDIITGEVNQVYKDRKVALCLAAKGPFSFWATDDQTRLPPIRAEELATELARCERDRQSLLSQLFGAGFGDDQAVSADQLTERQRRLAFLPQAKQDQLRALGGRYPGIDEQIEAVVDVRSAISDRQELQQLAERYAQKQAELSQILSPEDYEQYELNTSSTANNLRRRLAGFDPTEDEFRTLFRLWRAQDERLASIYALGQPEPGNLEVFAAMKEFLGEERYRQFRQSWGSEPVPPAAESSARDAGIPPP
jgi:hypothetical protein